MPSEIDVWQDCHILHYLNLEHYVLSHTYPILCLLLAPERSARCPRECYVLAVVVSSQNGQVGRSNQPQRIAMGMVYMDTSSFVLLLRPNHPVAVVFLPFAKSWAIVTLA